MKKVYCELHMFDLNQSIHIVDLETNFDEVIAATTMEELPEVISAICDSQKVFKVALTGNSVFCAAVAEDIMTYSKKHYNWNNLEIEVVK